MHKNVRLPIAYHVIGHPVIVTYIDISMLNAKYLTMYNMQMHAGAISKVLYSFASAQKKHTR